jgi:hypothetical protein
MNTQRRQTVKNPTRRPRWWLLYLSNGPVLVLMWLEARMPLSETVHTGLEIALVLVLFCLIFLWIRANELALSGLR